MLESLDAISEFFGKNGNTMEARRALRQDLEFQNIRLAKMYLSEFDTLRDCVLAVDEGSAKMESECREMAQRVSKADENMKMFMQKASILEDRRNFYIQQSSDIDTFLVQYQLTPEEVNCIHYAPINASNTEIFFSALKRLKLAYNDCKHMAEVHQYSAGFEMLELLGNHQDIGYQRLFEWVKLKCDDDEGSDFVDSDDVALQMAVKYLREVPVYFTQCQDLIICSRRTLLVQRFILALTQGGPGSHMSSRAIEMHSHDPVRYVGDMLSWMHQTLASEKEFLMSIFGKVVDVDDNRKQISPEENKGCATGGDADDDMDGYDERESSNRYNILSIPEILASCLEGLGRPLRVRIMQAMENCGRNIEILYTIADLLCFYKNTLSETLTKENAVYSSVAECLEECKSLFSAALDKQSDTLVQSTLSSLTIDLMSSNATKESSRQIQDILKVHQSALSDLSSNETEGAACYIYNVLGCCIHPILQACRTCGNNVLQQGSDMAIFMLNNVSTIKVG
jgi:conserved oligomeric Golgi complex subunit 6